METCRVHLREQAQEQDQVAALRDRREGDLCENAGQRDVRDAGSRLHGCGDTKHQVGEFAENGGGNHG